MINRLKNEGKIIIYISHFLDEITVLCDDYLVLRDGKMSGTGVVEDFESGFGDHDHWTETGCG